MKPPTPPLAALVVDDLKSMRQILRNLLKKMGYDIIDEAEDGGTAFVQMRQRDYALVISDWNMQPVTGYELLRRVRRETAMRQIPFILMTEDATSVTVEAARRAGATHFIAKPFNIETLRSKIAAIQAEE